MMLVINGNTITEQIQLNRENKRRLERINSECALDKEYNRIEGLLNHVKKNRRLYMKLVYVTAVLLFNANPVIVMAMNVDDAISKIDKFGNQILKLVQVIAYWVVLIGTCKKCTETAMMGDRKQILGEALKGVMIMGIIYFLPELFDMMKEMVDGQ